MSLLFLIPFLTVSIKLLSPEGNSNVIQISNRLFVQGKDIINEIDELQFNITSAFEKFSFRINELEEENLRLRSYHDLVKYVDADVESGGYTAFYDIWNQPPQYGIDFNGIVRFRGVVKNPGVSNPILKLPVSYRPKHSILSPAACWGGSGRYSHLLELTTLGSLLNHETWYGNFDYCLLDHISYPSFLHDGYFQNNYSYDYVSHWYTLTLQNGWTSIRDPEVYEDPYGIVRIRGTLVGGTSTGGTVLTSLTEKYRPRYEKYFIVMAEAAGDVRYPQLIKIEPSGDFSIVESITYEPNGDFLAIDQIKYPSDYQNSSALEFQNVTLLGGYKPSPDHQFPQYAKDVSGVVHLRGMVTNTTLNEYKNVMFLLPEEFLPRRTADFQLLVVELMDITKQMFLFTLMESLDTLNLHTEIVITGFLSKESVFQQEMSLTTKFG